MWGTRLHVLDLDSRGFWSISQSTMASLDRRSSCKTRYGNDDIAGTIYDSDRLVLSLAAMMLAAGAGGGGEACAAGLGSSELDGALATRDPCVNSVQRLSRQKSTMIERGRRPLTSCQTLKSLVPLPPSTIHNPYPSTSSQIYTQPPAHSSA